VAQIGYFYYLPVCWRFILLGRKASIFPSSAFNYVYFWGIKLYNKINYLLELIMNKKFYITTPIYYPSGTWHLGTCYTTVVCDALAKFKRMQGADVFYLTGTDEHGQKIEKAALAKGMSPKAFVDMQANSLVELWKRLDISYDKFIRTTDDYHEKAVQKIFAKLYEKGDIYKSEYEGWYCTPCESFWTDKQLKDGKCPDCGRDVELMKERSYFFRLSRYRDRVIELLENNPEFLQPKSRKNEMLNNFLRPGLQDLCVSRTSFKWGIEVPFDKEHIVYVWIDALTNYITALGYASEDESLFEKYWPADIHMMGKEIIRFHSIIWPALLMALDLPLPKKVYGHGWLLLGSDKISKSKGNIIDPIILSDRYSIDAVRYFLLREVPFGQDGMFTNSAFLNRINADLCNSLANLVSRTTAMISQSFGGILPEPAEKLEADEELIRAADELYPKVADYMDKLLVPEALEEIWLVIRRANKYIDETEPWLLAKDESKKQRLGTILYNLAETIRICAALLTPFLSELPKKIMGALNLPLPSAFEGNVRFGALKQGDKINKSGVIYPRIDTAKELAALEALAEAKSEKGEAKQGANTVTAKELIQYADFEKIRLIVADVIACEAVPKTSKLLKLTLDCGGEKRTVVSGIASCYKPGDLVGMQIVLVANLAPAKLCGIVSEGMILCADGPDGDIVIVSPIKKTPAGSTVR
jgi:methionyl-tRNA synthetase